MIPESSTTNMAARLLGVTFGRSVKTGVCFTCAKSNIANVCKRQFRYEAYAENGAILEKPVQMRLAMVKVMLVVVPFLTVGATISKNAAAWLEENDIFVPDDDEDD